MLNTEEARKQIHDYIVANMEVFNETEEIADDDNIFEKGFVSSIFAMRLLQFIEKEFSVEVPDDEILLENFSSINSMIRLVSRLREAL